MLSSLLKMASMGSVLSKIHSPTRLHEMNQWDLTSKDSVNISDSEAFSDAPSSGAGSDISEISLRPYAKRKVVKIIHLIKKMESKHKLEKTQRISLYRFIDTLRDFQYPHVKLTLLASYLSTLSEQPKAYYLHYYMFFLFYARHYHNTRATVAVINDEMKNTHLRYLACINLQLKYLQYIIQQSRLKGVSL